MAARPTRRPVNEPGPETTAKAAKSDFVCRMLGEERGNLRHELRGKGAAGQRNAFDYLGL